MALFTNEYIEGIRDKLSRPKNIDEGMFKTALDEAIAAYSDTRPDETAEDTTGDGSFEYPLPAGWVEEFSGIISLAYPFVSTDQTYSYLKPGKDYTVDRTPSGLMLRFLAYIPTTAETFRIVYTIPHVVTGNSTTIPVVDEKAVLNCASGAMADMMAASYEKNTRTTFPDTQFDLRGKVNEYHTQADRYYKMWRMAMGISEDGSPAAASLHTDTDWYLAGGGEPLTHRLNQL